MTKKTITIKKRNLYGGIVSIGLIGVLMGISIKDEALIGFLFPFAIVILIFWLAMIAVERLIK